MTRHAPILAAVLAALLTAPVGAADWIGFGDREPDNLYDSSTYMFQDRDVTPGESTMQVYFNAYPAPFLTGVNNNVGAAGTNYKAHPTGYYAAMLGIWKDCNNDGYVGFSEQGSPVYRAEVLDVLGDSICKPNESRFNDGHWVHEYIPFVMLDPCNWENETNRRADSGHPCEGYRQSYWNLNQSGRVFVNNTRIWADDAAPDDLGATGGGCYLFPNEGSTAHTGLLLLYATCLTGITQRINTADRIVNENSTALGHPVSTGLAFDDPEQPQNEQGHPLVFPLPVNLYGNPRQGEPGQTGLVEEDSESQAFKTYDCGSPQYVHDDTGVVSGFKLTDETGLVPQNVSDPTGNVIAKDGVINITDEDGVIYDPTLTDENGNIAKYHTPAPGVPNPTHSYYDGANETYNGVTVYAAQSEGDCTREDGREFPIGNGKTFVDGERESTGAAPSKRDNDWVLTYGTANTGLNPWGVGNGVLKGIVGESAPAFALQNYYESRKWEVFSLPGTGVRTSTLDPARPLIKTFYAAVDLTEMQALGVTLPAGSSTEFTYGADQCGSALGQLDGVRDSANVVNGWACDPDDWFRTASGTDITPRYTDGTPEAAPVGTKYHLRDVECYDQATFGIVVGNYVPCSQIGPSS